MRQHGSHGTGWLGVLAALGVVCASGPAAAIPVYYDFIGACTGSCGDFGLGVGDPVMGTITIDSADVTGDTTVDITQLAGAAFDFTFGSITYDLSELSDPYVNVTFSPDAATLTRISGSTGTPPRALFRLTLPGGDDGRGRVYSGSVYTRNTVTDAVAFAQGSWTRRSAAPIPEPSAALVFGIGLMLVASCIRRLRRP